MCCYISSNDNRIYAALESGYGTVAAFTAQQRLPAIKLDVRQATDKLRRRDKTGGRTFLGLPAAIRRRTTFDLATYLTEWPADASAPPYSALVRAAMGGAGLAFTGRTIGAVPDARRLTFTAAHGLIPGQAVRYQTEIRFVEAIVSGTTVPRIKFGTVVATVDRRLVPNCSAAMVTNRAQYPIPTPNKKQVT